MLQLITPSLIVLIVFAPPQPSNQQFLAGLVAMPTHRTRWLDLFLVWSQLRQLLCGFSPRFPPPARGCSISAIRYQRGERCPNPCQAAGSCLCCTEVMLLAHHQHPPWLVHTCGCCAPRRWLGGCVGPSLRSHPNGRHFFRLETGSLHTQHLTAGTALASCSGSLEVFLLTWFCQGLRARNCEKMPGKSEAGKRAESKRLYLDAIFSFSNSEMSTCLQNYSSSLQW